MKKYRYNPVIASAKTTVPLSVTEFNIKLLAKMHLHCYRASKCSVKGKLKRVNFKIELLPSGFDSSAAKFWFTRMRYH